VAQTKKRKRKHKHRGTPAGTIDRAGRTGRPQVKKDSKTIAKERRAERLNREPTWKGALNRAAIAAVVFTVLMFVIRRDQGVVANLALGFLVFLFYIPLGYLTDRAIFNFRRRKRQS
jgi:glycerol uptake facilitator-like aquaporin